MQILQAKLTASHSRIVVVSSGLVRGVKEADIGMFGAHDGRLSTADQTELHSKQHFKQTLEQVDFRYTMHQSSSSSLAPTGGEDSWGHWPLSLRSLRD
jgi:hypothetical protein